MAVEGWAQAICGHCTISQKELAYLEIFSLEGSWNWSSSDPKETLWIRKLQIWMHSFMYLSGVYLRGTNINRERTPRLVDSPHAYTSWKWAKAKSESWAFNQGIQFRWPGSNQLSHHHCLPEFALAGVRIQHLVSNLGNFWSHSQKQNMSFGWQQLQDVTKQSKGANGQHGRICDDGVLSLDPHSWLT